MEGSAWMRKSLKASVASVFPSQSKDVLIILGPTVYMLNMNVRQSRQDKDQVASSVILLYTPTASFNKH